MKSCKKFGLVAIALVLGALLCMSVTGCTSAKLVNSTEVSAKADVLGTVVLKTNKYSYTELLKEAQKLYPNADDVVHIQIDQQSIGKKYVVYGIAVSY